MRSLPEPARTRSSPASGGSRRCRGRRRGSRCPGRRRCGRCHPRRPGGRRRRSSRRSGRAEAAVDAVVPRGARDVVAPEDVVAAEAAQHVVARAAEQRVVQAAAEQRLGAGVADSLHAAAAGRRRRGAVPASTSRSCGTSWRAGRGGRRARRRHPGRSRPDGHQIRGVLERAVAEHALAHVVDGVAQRVGGIARRRSRARAPPCPRRGTRSTAPSRRSRARPATLRPSFLNTAACARAARNGKLAGELQLRPGDLGQPLQPAEELGERPVDRAQQVARARPSRAPSRPAAAPRRRARRRR